MKFILFTFISILSLVWCKLIFVHEVMRHGARTPVKKYEPYLFDTEPGLLTHRGAQQHFKLGKQLNSRYVSTPDFDRLLGADYSSSSSDSTFPVKFNTSEIMVLSTDYPRTIKSAQAHLLGMFSSHELEEAVLENNQMFLDLIDVRSLMNDTLIGYGGHQPAFDNFAKQMKDPDLHAAYEKDFEDVFEKIRLIFDKVLFFRNFYSRRNSTFSRATTLQQTLFGQSISIKLNQEFISLK